MNVSIHEQMLGHRVSKASCFFHFNVAVIEMLIVLQHGWAHTGRRGTNE